MGINNPKNKENYSISKCIKGKKNIVLIFWSTKHKLLESA